MKRKTFKHRLDELAPKRQKIAPVFVDIPIETPAAPALTPITPRKQIASILSPTKPPNSTPRKVSFQTVQVREYSRLHDGSGGVPVEGAFPLGLSWEVNDETSHSFSEYEKLRIKKEKRNQIFQPVPEHKRKQLLANGSSEQLLPTEAMKTRIEVMKLRKSREKSAGCTCRASRCRTTSCPCFVLGLPCMANACSCFNCLNPFSP